MEISKRDWKLFQDMIVKWQESYIEKLNNEYIKILTDDRKPSEKFWELEKRIQSDKKQSGVLFEMRKQNLPLDIVSLIKDRVISFKDIENFSVELQETVRFIIKKQI